MALRLAFMGTPDFAAPTLAELVGRGHQIAARKRHLRPSKCEIVGDRLAFLGQQESVALHAPTAEDTFVICRAIGVENHFHFNLVALHLPYPGSYEVRRLLSESEACGSD